LIPLDRGWRAFEGGVAMLEWRPTSILAQHPLLSDLSAHYE
jgi:hypothetical protein